jgi:TetR/AcrR family transcriptional regulator
MGKDIVGNEKISKVALIIEASQKRFGQYGAENTSMQEIADDLSISKAALYYYFPDKESLYRAVLEKEQVEFIHLITERLQSIDDPDVFLLEYVTTRLSYFRTLMNLSRLRLDVLQSIKPVFRDVHVLFREKEKAIIKNILDKGKENGRYYINDTEQTAYLFLDILKGLRLTVFKDKEMMVIDNEEYNILLKRIIAFTNIFISGLKYNNISESGNNKTTI